MRCCYDSACLVDDKVASLVTYDGRKTKKRVYVVWVMQFGKETFLSLDDVSSIFNVFHAMRQFVSIDNF